MFKRHGAKWRDLTQSDYPCELYSFDFQFRFPFEHVDDFWYGERRGCQLLRPDLLEVERFSNETDIALSADIASFLSKGPRFRIPPKLNDKFLDQLDLNLEVFSRQLRWNQIIAKDRPQSLNIPFQRNTFLLA